MAEVSERARPNLLLCALLMPLETGGGFPVEEELDAEEEEALALIAAACLEKKKWDQMEWRHVFLQKNLQDVAAPTRTWTEICHRAYSRGLKGVGA